MEILDLPDQCKPEGNRKSTAPYNFVPLPETIVSAVDDPVQLPDHDTYSNSRFPHTGYFDVELTTESPLFVRGMLTRQEFDLVEENRDRNGNTINEDTRFVDNLRNKSDFFHTGNPERPVIPGSSLRGMLRSMVEIVSYSRFSPLSDSPKITFRAIADKNDPLHQDYQNIIGRNGRDIQAGYLEKHNHDWKIRPAMTFRKLGLKGRGVYLKVENTDSVVGNLQDLIKFDDPDYRPQYHNKVTFDTEIRYDFFGKPYDAVNEIGSEEAGLPFIGTLVCTGNMLETADPGVLSPRTNYVLVPEPDNNRDVVLLNIPEETVRDYIETLTPFMKKDPPFDSSTGCLVEGRPVFYVKRGDKVLWFGHCPNFRAPAFSGQTGRVATPADYLPPGLSNTGIVDFTDAIFGYAVKKRSSSKQGDKAYSYKSRIRVTDAETRESDPFLSDSPFPPDILASPKPTAFQHYLVQVSTDKKNLMHYASGSDKTVIRGSKLYWKRGDRTVEQLRAKPNTPRVDSDGTVDETSTQHTMIRPVRSGVTFSFRVYFENLSDRELGALCWALHPLGDDSTVYCHQLGMGRPLGMGAVKLKASLRFNNRKDRYSGLFSGKRWVTGDEPVAFALADRGKRIKDLTDAFENEVLRQLGNPCSRLSELKRIGILLKMMELENGLLPSELETPDLKKGFKERRVLPDPSVWIPRELVKPIPTDNIRSDADILSGTDESNQGGDTV